MKLLSIIFVTFISILSFADSDLERLKFYCHSSISLEDFIKKNKIIIRVKNSSPGVNIIDSLVGIYPTNFNLEVRDKKNELLLESVKYDLHHIYWGHPERFLKDNILRIDPENCIFVSKAPNLLEEITKRMDINELDQAASMYNFSLAEKLIKEKKFQNKKGEYSWSALSILSREREDLALAMLENGFPIEQDEWRSALVTAVSSSNLTLAKKTISLNANVNYTYKSNGITPLLIAVMNGDIPMVRLLLENGANPKPIPPFNHNPLCFISGYDNITGKKLLSLVENSVELTKVLLAKGVDPNAKCGTKSSITPLSYLSKDEYAKVVDLLLDNGATPIDYHPQAHIPISIAQLINKKGHKIPSSQEEELKKFEKIKSSFLANKSPDDNEVTSAVKNAIYFNDVKLFSEALKLVNTDSLFKIDKSGSDISNRCITHLLTNAEVEFYKGLQDKGISLTARCGSEYFFKNLVESFVESCRYDLIELTPEKALQEESISRENIDNFFSDMGSTDDFRLNCLRTISNLSKKNVHFEKQYVLRKVLETSSLAVIDFALEEKIFQNNLLAEAAKMYQDDKYLMPIESDYKSKSISRPTRNYFLYKVGDVKPSPQKEKYFKKAVRYPLCGLNSEVGMYKLKKETFPAFFIPKCDKLNSKNTTYFEVYEEKDGFIAFIAIVDKFHGDPPLMGSKYYARPDNLSTPYYLSDGVVDIPLTKAGLKAVIFDKQSYSELGDENICNRSHSVTITQGTITVDKKEFPSDRVPNTFKIVSTLNSDPNLICPAGI